MKDKDVLNHNIDNNKYRILKDRIFFTEKAKSRKFIFAVLAFFSQIPLLALHLLPPETYANIVIGVLIGYLGSNVSEKIFNKNGTQNLPNKTSSDKEGAQGDE